MMNDLLTTLSEHVVLLPIVIPLAAAALALLLSQQQRVQGYFAFGAMTLSAGVSGFLLWRVLTTGQAEVFQLGGWAAPFGITIVGDLLSAFMVVMAQVVMAAGMLYGLGCNDKCARYPTFYPLFLTLATGLTGGLLTGDLFNLFVFTELLVISGAALTAMSDDKYGPEAAYKYFHVSLLAAFALLLSVGAFYISYGTLNMADIAARVAADPSPVLVPVGIVLLAVFFMIKSAVVPFHFWQPDFHTAAPTPVHAVLSSVVVKLGVYGFLRMNTLLFPAQIEWLQAVLVVLGIVGIFFGSLGAIGTYDAKRMLAYSTMGQIGFITVAIGWGTPLALTAALVYAFNHSLAKAAMLMLAGAMASRAPVKSAAFTVVQGVGKAAPFAGALFFIGGMALAGLPPTNGFMSKLAVFQSGVDAEQYLSLAFVGLASTLSLVYVARSFSRIWFAPMAEGAKPKAGGDSLMAPMLLVGASLVLGVWGQPLVGLAGAVVDWMLQPGAYIALVVGG